MKTRILSLLVFIFAGILSVQAQIENEIRNYVDSTELLMNNGRKLLVQKILDEDILKARKIFYYLKDESASKKCTSFYYGEELYIYMALSDWNNWFNHAEKISELNNQGICYNFTEKYSDKLYKFLYQKVDSIQKEVDLQDFNAEDRELLNIFLYLVKSGKVDDEYDLKVNNFKKKYKNSKYNNFLTQFLPAPTFKGAFAYSVGPTYIIPNQKLAEVFNSGYLFNLTMDFNIKKVYTSLYVNTGLLELATPIYFSDNNNNVVMTFNPGEKFSITGGGLSLGYFLVRSKIFHLTPFVTIGGYTLESNLYEDERDPEYQIYNSFTYGPGLHTELKLFEFNLDQGMYGYYGQSKSYISLKLDAGYDFITKHNSVDFKGNQTYFRFGLSWGIGEF
jgi:hypothetical protein